MNMDKEDDKLIIDEKDFLKIHEKFIEERKKLMEKLENGE